MCIRAEKDPGQAVVIDCWDRVSLVVMTTCTGNSQAKEGCGSGVDLFIDDIHDELAIASLP